MDLRAWLRDRVRASLAERRDLYADARGDLIRLRRRVDALAPRIDAARARLAPLDGTTTVHAAHARHAGVRGLFARRGLPGCPDCAVGADETLSEAAFGEGFDLNGLLDEIRFLEGS